MAAVRAFGRSQWYDFLTARAGLGRRLAVLAVALDLDVDVINRPEAPDIAGKIKHQTVGLFRRFAGTAANLLYIQARAAGRAQHADEVNMRDIETVRKDHHANQCGQSSGTKGLNNLVALVAGRLAHHHFAVNSTRSQRVAYQLGMRDTDAVD